MAKQAHFTDMNDHDYDSEGEEFVFDIRTSQTPSLPKAPVQPVEAVNTAKPGNFLCILKDCDFRCHSEEEFALHAIAQHGDLFKYPAEKTLLHREDPLKEYALKNYVEGALQDVKEDMGAVHMKTALDNHTVSNWKCGHISKNGIITCPAFVKAVDGLNGGPSTITSFFGHYRHPKAQKHTTDEKVEEARQLEIIKKFSDDAKPLDK